MRQPLSLGEIGMQTVEKCEKQRTKPEGQVICLSKGALFLCFTCYAAPGTNRWVPNRPVCILWCSFRMLYAMLTRYHSTVTLAFPLVRNRRKLRPSLIAANTPSAWMERLTRSRISSSVESYHQFVHKRSLNKYCHTVPKGKCDRILYFLISLLNLLC